MVFTRRDNSESDVLSKADGGMDGGLDEGRGPVDCSSIKAEAEAMGGVQTRR